MRNLPDLLVHFLRRNTSLNHVYLSTARDHCLVCGESVSESEAYVQHRVCPTCRFHYSLTARERIDLLADRGTFRETNRTISSLEPLTFSARRKGRKKAKEKDENTDQAGGNGRVPNDQRRTGLTEAVVTGHCNVGGNKATIVVLDFGFMGGHHGKRSGREGHFGLRGRGQERQALGRRRHRRWDPHTGGRPVFIADGQDSRRL